MISKTKPPLIQVTQLRLPTPPPMNGITPSSDIINAVIGSGLKLNYLHEHEELAWQFARIMVPVEGKRRMWVLPEGFPRLPLAFSLKATKS